MLLAVTISIIPVILSLRKPKEQMVPILIADKSPIEEHVLDLPEPEIAPTPVVAERQYGADLRAYERRDARFRRFLAISVQIASGGSGTIIYYDPKTQEAYILSCGHMWGSSKFPRSVGVEELRRNPRNTLVVTWYHDMTKLARPRAYTGRVLFWSTYNGEDCALIKVKIDWIPEVFTIAQNQPLNGRYHSMGCDSGSEVAYYGVEYIGQRGGGNLVTQYNTPRPGRSGGGLLARNKLVGICVATNGRNGFFTSLDGIHRLFQKNGYAWLLNLEPNISRTIPIKDWNGDHTEYPLGYIAMPAMAAIPLD